MTFHCRCNIAESDCSYPQCKNGEYDELKFNLPEAPKLAELKTRECSVVELQAALVFLIDQYNEQGRRMAEEICKKQDREWRATI